MGYTSVDDFWTRGGQILIGAVAGIILWNFLIWWFNRRWHKSLPSMACSQCKDMFKAAALVPCIGCAEYVCLRCRYTLIGPDRTEKKTPRSISWCAMCVPEEVKIKGDLLRRP